MPAFPELQSLRKESDSIGLRIGCFDLFHRGHLEGLQFAADAADTLVVGVLSDEFVRRRKGAGRPIQPEQDRLQAVLDTDLVDCAVVVRGGLDIVRAIWHLQPDVLLDSPESRIRNVVAKLGLTSGGIRYVIDQGPKVESTTRIIQERGLSSD